MSEKNQLERLDEEFAFKVNDNGKEVICYTLLTFENPDNARKYIVYTDGNKNADGTMKIFASAYTIENEQLNLQDITSDEEWDLIDQKLAKVSDEHE